MKEYNKSAFVADVIKALEDAERASQQNPKNKATLARDAYSKLQFDYPVSFYCQSHSI
jgi:ABC-type nitrate/sulfonate/bicarbonate transport system substrate-binding protein